MSSVMTTATASGAGFTQLLSAVREVYAAEIYFTAQPNLRFDQFATRKEELSAQPGQSITMPKFGNIKRGGPLTEGQRITTKGMSMSQLQITVTEHGNAIAMSERLLQVSFYDTMAAGSMLLGRDLAIVLDAQLRDAVRGAPSKVYANSKTSRNALLNGDLFTTSEIHRVSEALETNNAPKWGGDFWLFMCHPHQISSLRQSAGWVNASYYAGAQQIFTGEVGRFNDCRFISTSMMSNGFNKTIDATTQEYSDPGYDPALNKVDTPALNADVLYQALAFGEFSYGHAIASPVELRDNGVVDFGREHSLAWYAIWGTGLLETNNTVVIETA